MVDPQPKIAAISSSTAALKKNQKMMSHGGSNSTNSLLFHQSRGKAKPGAAGMTVLPNPQKRQIELKGSSTAISGHTKHASINLSNPAQSNSTSTLAKRHHTANSHSTDFQMKTNLIKQTKRKDDMSQYHSSMVNDTSKQKSSAPLNNANDTALNQSTVVSVRSQASGNSWTAHIKREEA